MLKDARKKLAEANKNNKTMTKELLAEKKRIEKIEKNYKMVPIRVKNQEHNNI